MCAFAYGEHAVIRHEIILRIKPEIPRERIDQALREAREYMSEIPGVERVRSGVNNTAAYRHAMVAVDLDDESALHRFQRHPLHVRAIRILSRMAESTAVGSYLVGSRFHR